MAFLRLALLLFPAFLSTRPGVVRVLFPGAHPFAAGASAQLLPDRQRNRHTLGERTRRMTRTAAKGDGGLQTITGYEPAHPSLYAPAILVYAAHTRARPADQLETESIIRHCEALSHQRYPGYRPCP